MAPEFGKPLYQLPLVPANVLKKHRVHEPLDTRFRSAARLLQALWREDRDLPIGSYVSTRTASAANKAYDPGTPRDRVLSAEEIEALWKWLEAGALPPADILKLQLATGARCGEISGLCAEEIDREHWTWTLPAARSKNKRPRVTPLVAIARQIVEGRLSAVQSGPFFIAETFDGSPCRALSLGARDKLPISKFTTDDLRRTVATMLAEMGIALDLVAAVVGHEAGGRETRTLVRHYVRTDLVERKKTVLEAWHRRLREIIEGQTARGNVTRLEDAKDPAVA